MSEHFQHLTQEKLGLWGEKKIIFTRKNLIQTFEQKQKKYLKPCLRARILHPALLSFWTKYIFVVGGEEECGDSELRIVPSPTQYIPATTLLHILWQPKLSPDFTKCTLEHKAVPG